MKQGAIRFGTAVAIFAALLLLWLAVVRMFNIPPYMLPTPKAVADAAAARFPSLLTSLWITGAAAAGGLLASIVAGVLIALCYVLGPLALGYLPAKCVVGRREGRRSGRNLAFQGLGRPQCQGPGDDRNECNYRRP